MGTTRLIGERLAKDLTRLIAIRWGESFPFYYVSEFPKSGGTWLARMVSDYLQLPFPQFTILPLGFSCVMQNHWTYQRRLRRVFYLHRDGRDVMTSLFFDRLRVGRHIRRPGSARINRVYQKVLGKGYDAQDSIRLMPRFIEHEFANPRYGSRVTWREHVESWLPHCEPGRVTALSYESLLADCPGALGSALEDLTGEPIDPWRLDAAVEKFSMLRQTGRAPGTEDVAQHIRKGIVGDWRNHFSREAAEVFDDLAGDALVALGYETDRSWVDDHECSTA